MGSVIHDEVEIEDFEYDEDEDIYFYPCPCGDRFEISRVSQNLHMFLDFFLSQKKTKGLQIREFCVTLLK